MVTQTPSELAELVTFPSSWQIWLQAHGEADNTWMFGWGGQSSGLSFSTHPSTMGRREPISTFPQNFSSVQAIIIDTTVLPFLFKLGPSHHTGVASVKVKTFRWCQREIRLLSASRTLSEYYHIKTSQHKEILFEQAQTPVYPIQDCSKHHLTHFGNPEILTLAVLWLTLESFCRSRTKITDVISWIILLWGKHRSWDQSSLNQILLCESYLNWISLF